MNGNILNAHIGNGAPFTVSLRRHKVLYTAFILGETRCGTGFSTVSAILDLAYNLATKYYEPISITSDLGVRFNISSDKRTISIIFT
jgi:hypothetical protein